MPDPRDAELEALRAELSRVRAELEAHEGLVELAMQDMRRIFEDLLATQSRLLQADKLASIGILAAGIAHELKNPLLYVHGNVWLLRDAIARDGRPPGNAAELLAQAAEGVERMMAIVRDVRTFSRSDEGRSAPEDLNAVLESVVRIVGHEVRKKADLVRDFAPLPKVPCNAQQIGQVFVNLLVNAAQAIEGRGTVTLRTRAGEGCVSVEVEDTGKGMTPEVQAKLFQPFFTTKGAEEGTGLGLSISADIVRRHGGSIAVRSAPGQGAAFTVTLPV